MRVDPGDVQGFETRILGQGRADRLLVPSAYDEESVGAFAVQAQQDSLEIWYTASANQGQGLIAMVVVCQDEGGTKLGLQRDGLLKTA